MGQVDNSNVERVVRSRLVDLDDEQAERTENIACTAATMIEAILKNAPPCADQTAAIRLVRQAADTAYDAIALDAMI